MVLGLPCPRWREPGLLTGWCRQHLDGALGLAKMAWPTAFLERSGVRGDGPRRLPCCSDEFGCLLVSYRTLARFLAHLYEHAGTAVKVAGRPIIRRSGARFYTLH